MILAQDIQRMLRTALIYTFELHDYDHEAAVKLAEIAMEPCQQTIDLCQRIIQLQLEATAITLRKDSS
jgi:hypothetical protein